MATGRGMTTALSVMVAAVETLGDHGGTIDGIFLMAQIMAFSSLSEVMQNTECDTYFPFISTTIGSSWFRQTLSLLGTHEQHLALCLIRRKYQSPDPCDS